MDARIDAYIAKSAPFAQPILNHIRDLVHIALPDVQETMKWSMPFFCTPKGKIVANMAAFKAHCAFGMWSKSVQADLKAAGFESEGSMGTLGRLTSVKDLPPQKLMVKMLKQAAVAVDAGESLMKREPKAKLAKTEMAVPDDFAAALKKSKDATKFFDKASPSRRREYLEWIVDAKREATRASRIEKAVAQMAEGKSLHWKYEKK